jgi:hypothetical protein
MKRGDFPSARVDGSLGFSFRAMQDGTVSIFRGGREVTLLRGAAAARFLVKVAGATHDGRQQLMARATGNYKRGNERAGKGHVRNGVPSDEGTP